MSGGIVGFMLAALLLGGTVAFAQSGDSTDSTLGQTFLTKLAGHLGISTDQLNTAIKQSGNETIDEAVTSGQITQDQGNKLKDRIGSGDFFRFGVGGHGRMGRAMFGCGVGLDTVASTLNMTTDDLRTELQSGKSLSDIITEHSSTVDAVVQALVADAKTQLDQAVTNGRITQDQENTILANLPARLTDMIENGHIGGPGMHMQPGTDTQPSTPGTTATPEGSSGL
jgi:hypothetical protein